MKNKKIAGRKIHNEARGRGYRGTRRRNESTADPMSEGGRCNKKSRTLTGTGGVPFPNLEMVALTSREENEPPPISFSDPTQYSCLPRAKLTAKEFRPPALEAWSPDSSSSNTREALFKETCPVDFPSKEEVVDDALMDFMIGFVDEEEMFNMPVLVNSMAEGLLLTPPAMKRGFRWSHDIDDQVDNDIDANYINLWAE